MSVRLCLPRTDGRAVIQPSDFTYLGMFKTPTTFPFGNPMSFSQGLITGRRVNGVTTVMLSGPIIGSGIQGPHVAEFAVPADAELSTLIASAPRTTQLRQWSFITRDMIRLPLGDSPSNYGVFGGMRYVENQSGHGSKLIWSYFSGYGNPGEFPNICSTILNNDGTFSNGGPWGTGYWMRVSGSFVAVPASVQAATGCGSLGACVGPRGSQASSPCGANLTIFTPPAHGTEADTPGGANRIATATSIYHTHRHPQARNANSRRCGSIAANEVYPCPNGSWLADYEPFFGGMAPTTPGQELNVTDDWIDACEWIDGPNKQGVLFFGQLGETISRANGFSEDWDYGGTDPTHNHQGYGSSKCCHGQLSATAQATGPRSSTLVDYLWIYDPADVQAVLLGSKLEYDCVPTSTTRVHPSFISAVGIRRYPILSLNVWFEPITKRLYVSQRHAYVDGFNPLPVVHVLAVNC